MTGVASRLVGLDASSVGKASGAAAAAAFLSAFFFCLLFFFPLLFLRPRRQLVLAVEFASALPSSAAPVVATCNWRKIEGAKRAGENR